MIWTIPRSGRVRLSHSHMPRGMLTNRASGGPGFGSLTHQIPHGHQLCLSFFYLGKLLWARVPSFFTQDYESGSCTSELFYRYTTVTSRQQCWYRSSSENLRKIERLCGEELSHRGLASATACYFTAHQADDFCSSMGVSAGSLARCPCPSEYSLPIWQTLKRYDTLAN